MATIGVGTPNAPAVGPDGTIPSWSDGLPYAEVTDERLERTLRGVDPDETLPGMLPPSFVSVTRRQVAEAVIMAGCRDDHLAIVETALRAVMAPAFNLFGIQTTTEPPGPLIVLNGPWRNTASVNCEANVFGNAPASNAPIGRALRLLLGRVGNAVPGVTDMATFGHPGKLSYCIGEAEEASPWSPLHVSRGFQASDNVVTAIGADGPINVACPVKEPEAILSMIALAMCGPTSNNVLLGGQLLVVLSPEHARSLAAGGMDRPDVQAALFERATVDATAIPASVLEVIGGMRRATGRGEIGKPVDTPEDILLCVAGGVGAHSTVVPTFGVTLASSEAHRASDA